MPRELVLGNCRTLITFDAKMNIRDLYYPFVGMWNHIGAHKLSFGFWTEGNYTWCDDPQWEYQVQYQTRSLVTNIKGRNQTMGLELEINDALHYLDNIYLKHMRITNLAPRHREIRVFFNQDFSIQESDVGDTAVYDPEINAVYHYKRNFYFLANGQVNGQGISRWATGIKRWQGAEGTWRDAEDGTLSGNPIAQGSVDSTLQFNLELPAGGDGVLDYWLVYGKNYHQINSLNNYVIKHTPAKLVKRIRLFWQHWLRDGNLFQDIPSNLLRLYRTSLCLVRAHIDLRGSIIASSDSDILHFNRDHYSYVWPRDGALIARTMIMANYPESTDPFFQFCANALTKNGYLLHKYNPDGTAGSSWHPWYQNNQPQLPIQEDETALVLIALWRHFQQAHNLEFLQSLFRKLVEPAAHFLCSYIDPHTNLPLPSYDLWEEHRGVWTFTTAAVYGGLMAAARIARLCANEVLVKQCRQTAVALRQAALLHLYDPVHNRFLKGLRVDSTGQLQPDHTPESSTLGVFLFGLLPARDPRMISTVHSLEQELWVKTATGGLARYAGDNYFRPDSATDHQAVPGNPWIICTLWLAQWQIEAATTSADLQEPLNILNWAMNQANSAGILPEQVHPLDGYPLSVAPLTWSHSTFIETVLAYAQRQAKFRQLELACPV